MANKQDFIDELNFILIQAKKNKKSSVEVLSKDLHDSITEDNEHSMPNCCNAMRNIEKVNFFKMEIINTTDKGQSTTIRIRYYL
jgi:hypothetical protein